MQYRQGDVLIEKIESIPEGAKRQKARNGKLILAEGEATGHHHALSARHAMMFLLGTEMFIRLLKKEMLEHQEHGIIPIEPGEYKVTRKREYHPKEIRQVRD